VSRWTWRHSLAALALLPLAIVLFAFSHEPARIAGAPTATHTSSSAAEMAFVGELRMEGFTPNTAGAVRLSTMGIEWAKADTGLTLLGRRIVQVRQGTMFCQLPTSPQLPEFGVQAALEVLALATAEANHVSFVPGPAGPREADVTINYAGWQLTLSCHKPL